MFNFICQCASEFEKLHGIKPDVLYLSEKHLEQLKSQQGLDSIDEFFLQVASIHLNIVLSPSIMHPAVSNVHSNQDNNKLNVVSKLVKAA